TRIDEPRVVRRKMNRRVPVETKHLGCRRCGNNIRLQVPAAEASKSLCSRESSELCLRVRSWRSARRGARRWLCASLPALARPTTTGASTSLRHAARSNAYAAASAQIQTLHRAALRLGVDNVVISRIDLGVKAVAAADAIPVSIRDSVLKAARLAWTTPRAIVLQTAVHVIRLTHVESDRVELRRGNRIHKLKRRALIVADVQAAVVSDHQVVGVVGIDPDRVVIAVRDARL